MRSVMSLICKYVSREFILLNLLFINLLLTKMTKLNVVSRKQHHSIRSKR